MRRSILVMTAALALGGPTAVFTGCGDGENATGAGGTGGKVDAGKDGDAHTEGGTCPSASFVNPPDGAKLTEADDADKNCANGFQYDVQLSVPGADGTKVTLFADGTIIGTENVAGGSVTFKAAQLKSNGSTTLSAQIGTGANCTVKETISITCGGAPKCDITAPVLSATHPMLNGVPVAQGGDRVSAPGTDYEAAFEVATSIEDGQPVTLTVDGSTVGLSVNAVGGKASFPGVALVPDGDHTVFATCTMKSGTTGKSAEGHFPVDSTAPDLAVTEPTDGQHFQGTTTFSVCGTTTSTDALDLPASLGTAQNNFCAGIGTATPTCAPATAGGADAGTGGGGCVSLTCPGGAPFDLTVTLTDGAGNPTTKKVTGVTCSSTLPSVQIVDPTTGIGSNVADHILAASAPQTKKDQDGTAAGAQYTVVACTDAATGNAKLFVGHAGDTLTQIGGSVAVSAAQASDNCPTGLSFVARFTNATLPESSEDSNSSALLKGTELRVDVEDSSLTTGSSPLVDVWVDSSPPILGAFLPNPLCGKLYQSTTAVVVDVEIATTSVPVNVTVTNGGTSTPYTGTVLSGGRTDLGNVTFALGNNSIVATTTEPAGNTGALQSPCVVTVGNPPIVTWVTPTAASKLNASTDGNSATAGWQGDLKVCTDVGGVSPTPTIQFSVNGSNLGSPIAVDASGCATLAGATIPDGDPVTITATTSDVAGKGVGAASLLFTVDTITPGAPTGLTATVKDRRQTSFHLSWTAPSDNGQNVFGYQVRVSNSPISAANFASATAVSYSGTPAAPGGTDGVDVTDRMIETDNYFAVAAVDKAGNQGPILAAGPSKATFNSTTLSGTVANEQFGYSVDGSSSINGDAFSDLIVGSQNGTIVYLYFGSAAGYSSTANVEVHGTVATFGFSASVIGDIDSDGLADIAIGSPFAGTSGRVFVYKGRATWPANLQESDADYVIDSADASFTSARLGVSLARLGDFNGDGVDDFAIGASGFNGLTGNVTIVLGVPTGTPFPASVTLPGAYGTRAIRIDGAVSGGRFGFNVIGAGKLYAGPANSLIVAATTLGPGRLYAFHGQAGSGGIIAIGSADATSDFPVGQSRGGTPLAMLGGLGTSNFALGTGAPNWSGAFGKAYVYTGTASVGPFNGVSTFTDSTASVANDAFGTTVIGGGFSGTSVVTSFIGGAEGDVIFSGFKENGGATKLYMYTGVKAALITSTDVAATADLQYQLPSDWIGCAYKSGAIKDLNGDGYGDIAIGELNAFVASYNGRVLVLW